jgi:hypothetical protein
MDWVILMDWHFQILKVIEKDLPMETDLLKG